MARWGVAAVAFTVQHHFSSDPKMVWGTLIDWKDHERWVPATRVEVAPGDQHALGAKFTAWTGIGPLKLEDRMAVAVLDWDAMTECGSCTVDKLGPTLGGTASFVVTPGQAGGTDVRWIEDVTIAHVPRLLAPVLALGAKVGFKLAIMNLARMLAKQAAR